jgi:hypothetical protein
MINILHVKPDLGTGTGFAQHTAVLDLWCSAGPDEPLPMRRDNQANRIGRHDEYGRRYLVDITMKF